MLYIAKDQKGLFLGYSNVWMVVSKAPEAP